MSAERPERVAAPEPDLIADDGLFDDAVIKPDADEPVPHDDAHRAIVEHEAPIRSRLPDAVDPGDFQEQSLIVDYDEDDYR